MKFDRHLLIVFFILIVIGVFLQYSANYPGDRTYFTKHIYWILISLPLGFFAYMIPVRSIKHYAVHIYIVASLLLIIVLLIPGNEGRWIRFGWGQFQPSEIMKVAYIILLAKFFSDFNGREIYFSDLIPSFMITVFPVLLIALEPDIGTAVIFLFIYLGSVLTLNLPILRYFLYVSPFISLFCSLNIIAWVIFLIVFVVLLFLSSVKLRNALLLFLINIGLGAISPLLAGLLKPYQKERIMSFLNPTWDPTGSGWQILQSKISIGSGGFFGKGFLNGIIKNLGFLPQTRTDFIFAVLGEEFGFLGITFILLIFGFFLYRIVYIAGRSKRSFKKYLSYAIFFYFLSQIVINISMTVGLLPVVGLPLPFISYGGTSLLISTVCVGLLLNMSRNFDV